MKHILLPLFLFASAVQAHPEQIVVRHPQANIDYYCPFGQSINQCVNVACGYATTYNCRIISQNHNVYYIETYADEVYAAPIVVVTSPTVYVPSPVLWFSFNQPSPANHKHHQVRHRPRRR